MGTPRASQAWGAGGVLRACPAAAEAYRGVRLASSGSLRAMEQEFWLDRWARCEIGFHQPDVDTMLQRWWPELGVAAGAPVFVPLCGKSLDLRYLARAGHPVIGVELAETAVRAFFDEAGETPETAPWRGGTRYAHGATTLYAGDLFELGPDALSAVRAVYDRAAIVALPPPMRERYAAHLRAVLPVDAGVTMLVLTVEYDQQAVPGPPFSVAESELNALYDGCDLTRLDERVATVMPPKFAGVEVVARAHRIGLAR